MNYSAGGAKKRRVSSVVLDASALLASLLREAGEREVERRLNSSLISAVNLSEVVAKALERGLPLEDVTARLKDLPVAVIAFDSEYAYLAASLRLATQQFGLSFGDRACLALGLKSGLPVLTADRSWSKVKIGVAIECIR